MGTENFRDEEKLDGAGALKSRHLIVITVVALAAAALVYYWFLSDRGKEPGPPGTGRIAVVPEGSRTVTLFFGDIEDAVLIGETREVAMGRGITEQVRQVMKALIAGPEIDAINTIPAGTRLLGVFYDSDSFTLFLDLSAEFVAGHPGGSAAEYHTVAAIMRTVSENFPEIQAVQLLVEGSQVSTIAGHINAHGPLLVRNWR